MNFRRNLHLAEFTIDLSGGERRIDVLAAVKHTHRTGLCVELELVTRLAVLTAVLIGIADGAGGESVSNRPGNREIDVTRDLIEFVDRLIRGSLRRSREQSSEMRASRHRNYTDFLGIESALLGLGTDEAHRALSVFPSRLIDRKSFRAGSTIAEVHHLKTGLTETIRPHFTDMMNVAAALIRAAGDHNDDAAVGLLGLGQPFDIGDLIGRAFFVRHPGELFLLGIGHLAFRPEVLTFSSDARQSQHRNDNSE